MEFNTNVNVQQNNGTNETTVVQKNNIQEASSEQALVVIITDDKQSYGSIISQACIIKDSGVIEAKVQRFNTNNTIRDQDQESELQYQDQDLEVPDQDQNRVSSQLKPCHERRDRSPTFAL